MHAVKQLTARIVGPVRATFATRPLVPHPRALATWVGPRAIGTAVIVFAAVILVASQPISLTGPARATPAAAAGEGAAEVVDADALDRLEAGGSESSRGERPAGAAPIEMPPPPPNTSGQGGVVEPDLSESGGAQGPTGTAAVGGDDCPTSGFGGVKPHVAQAGYHLIAVFGLNQSSVGGVAQRPGNPGSDHPRGLALDFTVGNDTGDALAAYADENSEALGITYILWQVPAHYDHVHISFSAQPGSGLPC